MWQVTARARVFSPLIPLALPLHTGGAAEAAPHAPRYRCTVVELPPLDRAWADGDVLLATTTRAPAWRTPAPGAQATTENTIDLLLYFMHMMVVLRAQGYTVELLR